MIEPLEFGERYLEPQAVRPEDIIIVDVSEKETRAEMEGNRLSQEELTNLIAEFTEKTP